MLAEIAVMMHENLFDSPFVVPVAGCAMVLGISVAGMFSKIRQRQIQSEERLAAIARGVPVPPTPEELAIIHGKPSANQTRRRASIRTAGIVLVFTGFGLVAFFIGLAAILQERNVLCGAAVGFIPWAIGAGFLVDSKIQGKEIADANASSTPMPAEFLR